MTTLNNIPPFSITSQKGRQDYYYPLEYYQKFGDSIPVKRKRPSVEETIEYKDLLNENRQGERWEQINGWRRLHKFTNLYDWRDMVTTGQDGLQGLRSPDGHRLLPEIFRIVLGQTMSIKYKKEPVPISNGEGFGLVFPGETPVMLTPFIYNDIILERWDHKFYFVQSKETGKWGALKFARTYSHDWDFMDKNKRPHWVYVLKEFLPLEYDEIYEDEICTDCSPTLFWVFRKGDKLGILTPWHYSEAIYEGYETDWETCSFILYQNGIPKKFKYHDSKL